jgi:type IV pilus biogenesis protein PilP
MRESKQIIVCAALAFVGAAHVIAQTVPAVQTVGDMAAVQSDTIMGKAKLARAQVLADLSRVSGAEGSGSLVGQPDSSLPQVKRIVEANGVSEATLSYSNGKIDVREGDRVPGGFVVVHIKPDASIVQLKTHSGKVIDVPVSSDAGLSATPGTSGSPNGMVGSPLGIPSPFQPRVQPPEAPATPPRPLLAPSLADSSKSNTN